MNTVIPNAFQSRILSRQDPRLLVNAHRRAGNTMALVLKALHLAEQESGSDIWLAVSEEAQQPNVVEYLDAVLRTRPFTYAQLQSVEHGTYERRLFKNGAMITIFPTTESFPERPPHFGPKLHVLVQHVYHHDDEKICWLMDAAMIGHGSILLCGNAPTEPCRPRWLDICHASGWPQMTFPVTDNPDYSDLDRDHIRTNCLHVEWMTEWMCQRLDSLDNPT